VGGNNYFGCKCGGNPLNYYKEIEYERAPIIHKLASVKFGNSIMDVQDYGHTENARQKCRKNKKIRNILNVNKIVMTMEMSLAQENGGAEKKSQSA